MSSISSVTSNPLDPYSLLQQADGQDPTQSNAVTSSTGVDPNDPTQSTDSTSTHHHHHHGGGVPSQIESAVTSALQNAPDGSDPNQTIQDAIAAVLKKANGQPSTTDPSQDPTNSSDPNAATTTPADFKQLLQSFNIDPKQFQQDFQAAVKNVQPDGSGSVDFSSLFQNFPPGSSINTVA